MASLPDTVPNDPEEIAKAVSTSFDSIPTVDEYAQNPEEYDLTDEVEEAEAEEPAEKLIEAVSGTGFVINSDEFDFDDDESEEEDEDI